MMGYEIQYLDNALFVQEQLLYAKCTGPFDVRLHHATMYNLP